MKRKVNFRVLCALVVGAALLAAGGYFLHSYQLKRNAGALLRKAAQERAEGRLQEAADDYVRYLQLVPADGDATADYALTLADMAKPSTDRRPLFDLFESALRLKGDRDDARRRLVDLYMGSQYLGNETDYYAHAQDHLKVLLEHKKDDPELEELVGRCLEGRAQYAAAYVRYDRVINNLDPKRIDSYCRIAYLLRDHLKDKAKGRTPNSVMVEMIKANPSPRAYVARARYWRDSGAGPEPEKWSSNPLLFFGEVTGLASAGAGPGVLSAAAAVPTWGGTDLLNRAEEDLRAARAAAPDDVEVLLESAEVARARGWLDLSLAYAKRGLALHPKDVRTYRQVMDLELSLGRPDEAVAMLRRGVVDLPEEGLLRFMLADLLLRKGETEEAAAHVAKLKEMHLDQPLLDYLDGCRKLARQDWLEASKHFEKAYVGMTRQPELARQTAIFLGRCYEELGDPDREYAAYQKARTDNVRDPLWLQVVAGLAHANLGMNRLNEALEDYRKLIPRLPAARLIVARLLIDRNYGLPRNERNWAEADQLLDEAAQLFPKNAEVAVLRARALAGRGEEKKAKALLEEVTRADPKNVQAWVALAGLESGRQDFAAALAVLDRGARPEAAGDVVDFRLARAGIILQQTAGGKITDDQRKALKQAEEGAQSFPPPERERLARGLADGYILWKEFGEARRLLERLVADRPADLPARLRLFDLTVLESKAAGAGAPADDGKTDGRLEEEVREIRRIEGDKGTLWRYARAAALLNRARRRPDERKTLLDEARRLLKEVAAARPGWPRAHVCQAQLETLAGKTDEAIRAYKKAIDLGERDAFILLEAVNLMVERHRYAEAYAVVQQLPEQSPALQGLGPTIVTLSLRARDTDVAERTAREALNNKPTDYRSHLLLAQIYSAKGERDKAEKAIGEALKYGDDAPETWSAWVQFLARSGRAPEAKAALEQARQKLKPEEKHRLVLSFCCDLVGETEQAKGLLRAAVKERPDDVVPLRAAADFFLRHGEAEEGKRYLNAIIRLKDKYPEEAATARQVLAFEISAGPGDYDQKRALLAEMGFLEKGERRPDETLDDKRGRVFILLNLGRRGDRLEGIRILENAAREQPLPAADRMLLAQLCEAVGDFTSARKQMQEVLGTKEGDNPQYLAHAVNSLLGHGDVAGARFYLGRLAEVQPDAWRTAALQARVLHAQKQTAEAADLLLKFSRKKDAPLLAVAEVLEEIGDKGAEEVYRRAVEQLKPARKDAPLLLASYLGRAGRLADALKICEQARQECPPLAVLPVAVEILYASNSGPEDWERVDGWIQDARQTEKDPRRQAELLKTRATLDNLRENYARAESAYVECLRANPRDDFTLNNLAWLLAARGKNPNPDAALEHIQKAIGLVGPKPDLLDTRAIVYLAQGNADLAVKELEDLVEDAPTPTAYFHLARAHYAANHRKEAKDNWLKALGKGLKQKDLHPFERDKFDQFKKEFGIPATTNVRPS
jgi:tetratricopeptide (TPR) repeat protein